MYYNAQNYQNPARVEGNRLTVTGEGSVSAVPNQATVNVGVITENKDVNAAQKENTDKTTAVISALLKLGIKQEDIQTSVYRVEPQYNYENGQQVFRAYRVEHQLQVTVKDLSKLGQVIDQAVASGANFVSSIQFSVSNPEAYYNQALSIAIQNARNTAMAMATTLNVQVNPVPIVVQELSQPTPPRPVPFAASMVAQESSVPVQPGENKFTANVKIVYTYH